MKEAIIKLKKTNKPIRQMAETYGLLDKSTMQYILKEGINW